MHFHVVIRLDARPPIDDPDLVLPPPAGYTTDLLAAAVEQAAMTTTAPALTADADQDSVLGWGSQFDVRTVPAPAEDGGSRHVAGYLAKYATKSTDEGGALDHRLATAEDIDLLAVNEHLRRLVATAWQLGGRSHLSGLRLRLWAHALGYRGHWATRSRRYSTTLKALRLVRQNWHYEPGDRSGAEDNVVPLARAGEWRYAGRGYRTPGDAWLAESAGAAAERARAVGSLERRVAA